MKNKIVLKNTSILLAVLSVISIYNTMYNTPNNVQWVGYVLIISCIIGSLLCKVLSKYIE